MPGLQGNTQIHCLGGYFKEMKNACEIAIVQHNPVGQILN